MAHGEQILVVMGATGTGKSAVALELAQRVPAVIINADAMQMVDALRILTARPTEEEMQRAEHALYGVLPAHEPTSVARWLALVKPEIERARREGKLPILVGGTGMYIKALMEGLAEVPPIPDALRSQLAALDPEARYRRLQEKDAVMACRLKPGDTQRIRRALEVVEATGTSLAEWQSRASAPLFPGAAYRCFYLELPREKLYARLDARFVQMMEAGALAEVEALLKRNLPPGLPILKATGVPELTAQLKEELTPAEALCKAQQSTRNYAKRQLTWLRNQMGSARPIAADSAGGAAAQAAEILAILA